MDIEAKARAADVLKSYGASPVLVTVIKKFSGLGTSQAVVAVSDQFLVVFDLKATKQKMLHSWLSLKQIYRKEEKLYLKWTHGKLTFDATNATVVKAIYEVLQRVLLPSELLRCGFETLMPTRVSPNAAGFLPRLKEHARLSGKKLSAPLEQELKEIVVYSQNYVSVCDLPDVQDILPLLVNCLPLAPTISDVSFRNCGSHDVFDLLAKLSREWNFLRRIEIVGPKTSSYPEFLLNWKNSGNRKLRCLSFENTQMTAAHLDLLAEMIVGVELVCIELHNAVSDEAIPKFYSRFFSFSVMDNLRCLNLDRTKNLDLDLLLPRISSLLMLSLEECGIEVSHALEKISKFTQLNVLNLSKNECKGVVRNLPPCLHTLYLDGVKWSEQTFSRFLVFASESKLCLSVSMAIASDAEWKSVFSSLEEIRVSSLVSLNWARNPVNESLFALLRVSGYLTELNLSGCFRESSVNPVMLLCGYLSSQFSLKRLILQSTKTHYIGRAIGPILDAVWHARSHFEYLDLRDSLSGDYGVLALRSLLIDRRYCLNLLLFDGLSPSTAENMIDFMKDIAKLERVKISFPHNDMTGLCDAELITKEVFDEVKHEFTAKGDSSVTFDKPFEIFRHFPNYSFPHFVTDRMIADAKSMIDEAHKRVVTTRLRAGTQMVARVNTVEPLIPHESPKQEETKPKRVKRKTVRKPDVPVVPEKPPPRRRAKSLRRASAKRPITQSKAATSPIPAKRGLRRASTGDVIEDVDEIFPKTFPAPAQTQPITTPKSKKTPRRGRSQSLRIMKRKEMEAARPVLTPHVPRKPKVQQEFKGPNWNFPIPLTYTFDDERILAAFRDYQTENILSSLNL